LKAGKSCEISTWNFMPVTSRTMICRKKGIVQFKDVQFIAAQKESKESYDGKGIRMDVYLQNGDTIYDVEMQTTTFKELAKRMRYYQGMTAYLYI